MQAAGGRPRRFRWRLARPISLTTWPQASLAGSLAVVTGAWSCSVGGDVAMVCARVGRGSRQNMRA